MEDQAYISAYISLPDDVYHKLTCSRQVRAPHTRRTSSREHGMQCADILLAWHDDGGSGFENRQAVPPTALVVEDHDTIVRRMSCDKVRPAISVYVREVRSLIGAVKQRAYSTVGPWIANAILLIGLDTHRPELLGSRLEDWDGEILQGIGARDW